MSWKSILLYLNDERRAAQALDLASRVAGQQHAHVTGLFVVPSSVSERSRQTFRQTSTQLAAGFGEAMRGNGIASDWMTVEAPVTVRDPVEVVVDRARVADLVITGQADTTWEYSALLDCPDRLALESGRPTLIVPHSGRFPKCGSRIVIAWNGKREAARAVFDALPLLRQAEAVRILSVDPKDADFEGSALAVALARHGAKCETAQSVTAGIDVSDDLLNRVTDFGADLLVMGCYGHSRFREMVMGGASRGVLQHMTVPVLMSH